MQGYYHKPTLWRDRVVFVCEDDLWEVPASGGLARRLTSNPGRVSDPWLSPDGAWLACTCRDEGHSEVHVMPAGGGAIRRLTFLGAETAVAGWTPDSQQILFATTAGQPFRRSTVLGKVPRQGGPSLTLPWGPAAALSFGPGGGQVLGRFTADPARWKRYRGGTVGQLWIDPEGSGDFRTLLDLPGNVTRPLWVAGRIYFGSDHEGIGNLYSCLPDGSDLVRHTHHADFYLRHPNSDGRRVVYQCGAELYLSTPGQEGSERIEVDFRSPRVHRQRRFVRAADYLEDYEPHPEGHSLLLTVRGRPFTMACWEQGATQHGEADGVRYRLGRWLSGGDAFVCVSDRSGEERLEVHALDGSDPRIVASEVDLGRPVSLEASPRSKRVAFANHRHELILVDLEEDSVRVLDRSPYARISGLAWSPDGAWLAYSFAETPRILRLKIVRVADGEVFPVTRPEFRDVAPAFDPEGRFLYFLSYRDFDPVYDNLFFDLNFPRGMRPYLVTLREDVPSPFVPEPRPPHEGTGRKKKGRKTEEEGLESPEPRPVKPVEIDLENLPERVLAFPVEEGRYGRIEGMADQVLFTSYPVVGSLGSTPSSEPEPGGRGTLVSFDLRSQERKEILSRVSSFRLSGDARTLACRSGRRLRVLPAGKKPEEKTDERPGRKSGWIDLARIRPSVLPGREWEQMYREAWRLMRDQFWSEDMSGVDWGEVSRQYLPLLERVGTRAEFSDLLWEVQGELGTSHAYEIGGDYPGDPEHTLGLLGADFEYDPETESYRIVGMLEGDSWDPDQDSPLRRPGLGLRVGDRLLALNGRRLGSDLSPAQVLVNQAGVDVQLRVIRDGEEKSRIVSARTLSDDTRARYRQWVAANRRRVHELSQGRVGYLHIPNMGPQGYAEFHRGYLAEVDRPGLLVDVRFNGGGHVSPLLLEKLSRRRLGYDVQRWGQPIPYPQDSPQGPMAALTNELAGSDGDVFSHVFKMMNLGPLVGKRTWGGVIGVWPRHRLVDGTVTTQPEFAFWFEDVGWGVENHGTEPDVVVEFPPQESARGRDPQLEKAVEIVLEQIRQQEAQGPPPPDWENRPHRTRPPLR